MFENWIRHAALVLFGTAARKLEFINCELRHPILERNPRNGVYL